MWTEPWLHRSYPFVRCSQWAAERILRDNIDCKSLVISLYYTYRCYYFLISTEITFTLQSRNVWNCSPNRNQMANVPHIFFSPLCHRSYVATTKQHHRNETKRPKHGNSSCAFFFFRLLIFSSVSIVGSALAMRSIGIFINSWSNVSLRYQMRSTNPLHSYRHVFSPMFLFTLTKAIFTLLSQFPLLLRCHVHSSVRRDYEKNRETISEKSKAWGNRRFVEEWFLFSASLQLNDI